MFKLRTDKKSSIVSRRRPIGRFARFARMRKAASIEEKKKALLEYLKEENLVSKRTTAKAISVYNDEFYSINDMEFIVGTEDECFEFAKDETIRLYEELGMEEAFGESLTKDILSNPDLVNINAVKRYMREHIMDYVEDISSEEGRVKEELEELGVDTKGMSDDEMAESLIDQMLQEEPLEWFDSDLLSLGEENWKGLFEYYNILDVDKMAEYLVNEHSSVKNELASYDGEEIDLGNDLYAYRTR